MSRILSFLVLFTLIPKTAVAQIIPDSSLDTENSIVESDGDRDTINGGAIRDANLFHSFQEFNVEALREAYFSNPDGIANIFSRVTGNNISDIQGVLGVLGDANLYLINPNGILFGENARLDLNGSFFATTADSVLFENGTEFSAVNPDAPPLLTINIPIGLRFRDNPGDISNSASLLVNQGENITLIGGNIRLDNGNIFAPGGRVELGGLSASGEIEINNNSNLSFPDGIARGDVSLRNGSKVDVRASGGGFITVNASNLELTENSNLLAGIAEGLGSLNAQAGDINLNISEKITASQGSSLQNRVNENSTGNAGNINAQTDSLTLTEGSFFSASTFGEGEAGNIIINAANTISADGLDSEGLSAGIFSNVTPEAFGNGGEIQINTGYLELSNGASISASTVGKGNAGNVNINAASNISLDGSNIFSDVIENADGNAGNIEITTDSLVLKNDSQLDVSTFGQGDAGNISINATDTIYLDNSNIFSTVQEKGNGGNIEITTDSLALNNGSQLDVGTSGIGDAGNITINATDTISLEGQRTNEQGDIFSSAFLSRVENNGEGKGGKIQINTGFLELKNDAMMSASTLGQGDAGNIIINAAGTISLDGSSTIFSIVGENGEGNAGNIEINTDSLTLNNSSQLAVGTDSRGDAGNIIINAASNISLDNSSTILSSVEESGEGNAGNIAITTDSLTLNNGSQLVVSTNNKGDAGNIIINAANAISLDGQITNEQGEILSSAFFSSVEENAEGNGGIIDITASSLVLSNGATLVTRNYGTGKGSDIFIGTDNLSLTNGSSIAASTFAEGNGGNITINATESTFLDSNALISSNVALDQKGNAGNIQITTDNFSLNNWSEVNTTSLGQGNAGDIRIIVTDNIFVSKNSFLGLASTSEGSRGNAGNIILEAQNGNISFANQVSVSTATRVGEGGSIIIKGKSFSATNGVFLIANTFGDGDAGNVVIEVDDSVSLDESIISTLVQEDVLGDGGDINITANSLGLTNGSQINTGTGGQGNAGNVTIRANDTIFVDGVGDIIFFGEVGLDNSPIGIYSEVFPEGTGDAGNIDITTNSLFLTNLGVLSVSNLSNVVQGDERDRGSILVKANSITLDKGGSILAATNSDRGGNVNLQVEDILTLRESGLISAQALENANGGNVNIDAKFIIAFPNQNNDIIASASQGRGGEINITTEGIFGLEERSSNPENETNDIDASSQFGLSGEVNITRPDIEPASGLLDLTQEVVDPAELIAQNVCTQTADSEFVDIGKGGLPQNPEELLTEESIEVELVKPITSSGEEIKFNRDRELVKQNINRKPPAQGWIFHENGIVELVAYNPNLVGEQRIWDNYRNCQ